MAAFLGRPRQTAALAVAPLACFVVVVLLALYFLVAGRKVLKL